MSRDWKTQWMLNVNSTQTAQKIQCNFDQNSRIIFCGNWQVDSKTYDVKETRVAKQLL